MNDTQRASRFSQKCFFLNAKYEIPINHDSIEFSINQYSACTFVIILIIPTVALNGIFAATIFKRSHLREKISYFLVMLQSVADLGIGVLSLPLYGYIKFVETRGSANCITNLLLVRCIIVVPIFFALLTITVLTMERYVGVLHPFKHRMLVTKKRIFIVLCIGTIFGLAVLALSFFKNAILIFFFSAVLAMFIIKATFVYINILIAIRKRAGTFDKNTSPSDNKIARKFSKEIKMANRVLWLWLVFCYVSLPELFSERLTSMNVKSRCYVHGQ